MDEARCVKTWLVQIVSINSNGHNLFSSIEVMIFVLLFHILGISVTSYQIMYVQILALKATSTAEIFKAAKTRLSLDDPAVIGISLNRTNIKHYVEPLPLINTLYDLMAKNLSSFRLLFPKTLIFCQTIAECSLMYETIIITQKEDLQSHQDLLINTNSD